MSTAYITHPDCILHEMGAYHPEQPARMQAIEEALRLSGTFDQLLQYKAHKAEKKQLELAHTTEYIDFVHQEAPEEGMIQLDPDTSMNAQSLSAAYRASGAVVQGVDLVMRGECRNAFCNVRPPGHHAEHDRAMGFCIFNNISTGALHALEVHGLERVAILDFDVHHGNGTEDIFCDDKRVMLCSVFQHPFYPGTPYAHDHNRLVNVALPAGSGLQEFVTALETVWIPALETFTPQFIFISAGFDAHELDPLAGCVLKTEDYYTLTRRIVELAALLCQGRIVSLLEGGYHLEALGASVVEHLKGLIEA